MPLPLIEDSKKVNDFINDSKGLLAQRANRTNSAKLVELIGRQK